MLSPGEREGVKKIVVFRVCYKILSSLCVCVLQEKMSEAYLKLVQVLWENQETTIGYIGFPPSWSQSAPQCCSPFVHAMLKQDLSVLAIITTQESNFDSILQTDNITDYKLVTITGFTLYNNTYVATGPQGCLVRYFKKVFSSFNGRCEFWQWNDI